MRVREAKEKANTQKSKEAAAALRNAFNKSNEASKSPPVQENSDRTSIWNLNTILALVIVLVISFVRTEVRRPQQEEPERKNPLLIPLQRDSDNNAD